MAQLLPYFFFARRDSWPFFSFFINIIIFQRKKKKYAFLSHAVCDFI